MSKRNNLLTKIGIVALLVVVIAAVVTCPNKFDHKVALTDVVREYQEMKDAERKSANPEGGISPRYNHDKFSEFSRIDIMNMGFEAMLEIDNYYLFSVGYMPNPQGKQRVSFGIFGKVFTPSLDDIDRSVKKKSEAIKIERV